MSELDDLLDPGYKQSGPQYTGSGDRLPNANATLTLGILSIVGCFLYGLPGLIMGIIALAIHRSDKKLYVSDPGRYAESYKNAKAGFVCAIIGTSLSAAVVALFLFSLLFALSASRIF